MSGAQQKYSAELRSCHKGKFSVQTIDNLPQRQGSSPVRMEESLAGAPDSPSTQDNAPPHVLKDVKLLMESLEGLSTPSKDGDSTLLDPGTSSILDDNTRTDPAPEVGRSRSSGLCFSDGKCHIDYILVYRKSGPQSEKREIFERNIRAEGLQMEKEASTTDDVIFLKLHAPWEVLCRYAELMNIRMPFRMEKRINRFRGWLPRKPMKFDNDTLPDLEENESFTAPFSRSRIHQRYFGEKIGLYFAWLGWYTGMLFPAALVGLMVFLYGWFTLDHCQVSKEICQATDIIMCPICDEYCPYLRLSDSCIYAKNILGAFVAQPAFCVLQEEIRPQFEAKYSKKERMNPISGKPEPYQAFTDKYSRLIVSASGIIFMILVVIAAVFGIVIYRVITVSTFAAFGWALIRNNSQVATTGTAVCINFCIIMLLNVSYDSFGNLFIQYSL
ncbi:unnamed protein product [Coregonus sp. 'balchen']|nr:unnamed protein product [Coregonus sp. 'balchen']